MPTVNTNTTTDTIVTADIYDLASFYDDIRKANIPDVDDEASMSGIFGYLNEMFSQTMQNAIIMNAETTNEMLPTRAKFTKNVLTHALNLGITDIKAKPATIRVMIYLPIDQLINNMINADSVSGNGRFILDSKVPIYIGDYEFHLDYDVIISRIKSASSYIYTARYDLFNDDDTIIKRPNPISNITNPYIDAIIQTRISGINFIAFAVNLHQVSYKSIHRNIVTDSSIENKTLTFSYDGQLTSFNVAVVDNGKTLYFTPIYNGLLDYSVEAGTWCNYEYVSDKVIRVLFNRDSYIPPQGATVIIEVFESSGASGNFTFNTQFRTALKSDRFNNYNGMYAYIYPLNGGRSSGGVDEKSITELKKIIPRENTARKAIINMTDLENFFNSTSIGDCHLYFKKKRDNPFERLYYIYMIMQNNGNIYPTNTINVKANKNKFISTSTSNNIAIPPGSVIYYYDHGNQSKSTDLDIDYGYLEPLDYVEDSTNLDYNMVINSDNNKVRVFEYVCPFLISIDSDLIASYLLTIMDKYKSFLFDSINNLSDLQFITTNMHWYRYFYSTSSSSVYDNKYTMTMDIAQNNSAEYGLVRYVANDSGEITYTDVRVKVYVVFYADETKTTPYKYVEAELYGYESNQHVMSFKIELETDDTLDSKNRIKIKKLKNCKPSPFQLTSEIENNYGFMNSNTYCKVFILADFGTRPGDVIKDIYGNNVIITETTQNVLLYGSDGIGGRYELETIIPTKDNIIYEFLNNNLSIMVDGEELNVVNIIRHNENYLKVVKEYNGDESETPASILKYLRNNQNSAFVLKTLLTDSQSLQVISSYSYEDINRYTLCNTMVVENGVDFYYDYSNIMHSTVSVERERLYNESGEPLYREIVRYDASGTQYTELSPVCKTNTDGSYNYIYSIDRLPVIKKDYLNNEYLVQTFINTLEERRLYMNECRQILEDTFDIDFKFINTYGPSKTFYYVDQTATTYDVKVITSNLNVYSEATYEDTDHLIGILKYGQVVTIDKTIGQWGHISSPYNGWLKLSETEKINTFIDNVAISMKFSLEARTNAGKSISSNIITDIKNFIEDINDINELHVPNIITLITNNYREQLVWFDFLGINDYGIKCKHLYVYENDIDDADIVPEFINVATSNDGQFTPLIDISVQ